MTPSILKLTLLSFITFVCTTVTASEQEDLRKERIKKADAERREHSKSLGDAFKKNGWKEIVRCDDGHTWSYIIEKNGEKMKICKGINARGGPTEYPCVDFTGHLAKFKEISSITRERKVPLGSCWRGFDQDLKF